MEFFSRKPAPANTTIENQIEQLREQIRRQQAIQNLANRIHAAQNVKQIIVDLKEEILRMYDASVVTIYAVDPKTEEIYSLFLSGPDLAEIRVPIGNGSIAGFAANNRRAINIADAYDESELRAIHPDLSFDRRWDQKSGLRTTQVLTVPILHEDRLMGIVQILNKNGGIPFSDEDQSRLEELAQVLGIAFYNQERIRKKKKSRFDYLLRHGLIKDEELEGSWAEARKSRETIEDYLMKKYKIAREAIVQSLEEFFGCPYISFSSKYPIPVDLLRNLKEEYLRRELWVPLERKDGKIRVCIDDPNNILKRDMIESLLKTGNVEYCVSMYDDILRFINQFYRSESGRESIDDLIGKLEVEESEEEEDAFSESDSIIMQLVNKIIRDAHAKGASDIHIEPNTMTRNVEIRFRVDGDLALYQTVPFTYRSAIISRIKIMSNLDITERRLPQDGKIKFRRSRGEESDLRVATLPTQGGVEDVVMRILAKGDTLPLEVLAMSARNYRNILDLLEKPYGIILAVGPTGSGKTTTLHAALRHINTPETKIWTAEDPVEITQNGLRQVQVNPKVGLDFAHAMRSFLRADPDV
ncbi:MAG TPA: ATPase, T2SS/T4P/T4SS family, partial [Syntrophales bacterium]|nr:ATPase, T2SS/T4P/T4SS family [Syntrophales bacterium]